jgi:hypothetical protein
LLRIEDPPGSVAFEKKRRDLKRRGIDYTEDVFCLSPSAKGGGVAGAASRELWAFIRVMHGISDADIFAPRRALAQLCKRQLNGYPTSSEFDEALLAAHTAREEDGTSSAYSSPDPKEGDERPVPDDEVMGKIEKSPNTLNARMRLIIMFRLAEKRLLRELIELLGGNERSDEREEL